MEPKRIYKVENYADDMDHLDVTLEQTLVALKEYIDEKFDLLEKKPFDRDTQLLKILLFGDKHNFLSEEGKKEIKRIIKEDK